MGKYMTVLVPDSDREFLAVVFVMFVTLVYISESMKRLFLRGNGEFSRY